jgi:DNA-binding protein H-NS
MDLSVLSIGELQKLRTRVEREINSRNNKQRGQALVEIKTIVAKYGLKLDDVVKGIAPPRQVQGKAAKPAAKLGIRAPAKSVRKAGIILYRHPENPQLIWGGGRGRRPQWIKDWESSGRSLDEVRVV